MRSFPIDARTRPTWGVVILFGAALVACALLAHEARAGKPGSQDPAPNGSFQLLDLPDDAILGDGGGAYDATVVDGTGSGGMHLTVETGRRRGMVFDFTRCVEGCAGAPNISGLINDVTVLAWLDRPGASFDFSTKSGRWRLTCWGTVITAHDDDGDGTPDRYELSDDGTTAAELEQIVLEGGRGQPQEYFGRFTVPWHATLYVQG